MVLWVLPTPFVAIPLPRYCNCVAPPNQRSGTGGSVLKETMLKQKGFVRRLQKRLVVRALQRRGPRKNVSLAEEGSLNRISVLTDEDLDIIISEVWAELGACLRANIRVSFEGWISFFTKPIKRNCYNMIDGSRWVEFKRRIRSNSLDRFKEQAEVTISEEGYKEFQIEQLARKKK
jgi:predicted DCC family thiol-disulfide oxidoreductase YuxK